MARGELNIRLGLDSSGLRRGLRNAETELQKSVRKLGQLGQSLSISVTAPLAGIATAAVGAFVQFDKLKKGLIAVTGSSSAAQAEFEKLKESARLPGLGLEEALQGSVRLQAVGLTADEARKSLETFGTAIAATGGGAENLERVTYQLTQMISKNRILQEDFGIIQENIPLIGDALENAFGTRNIEAIRDTGISAQEFNARLVDSLSVLPELQGDLGGLGNDFENLKNDVKGALVTLGESIAVNLNLRAVVQKLSDFIAGLVERFNNLSPAVQKTIIQVGLVAAAIGPAIIAVKALAVAFTFLTGPIGLATVAIAGLIIGVIALYNNSAKFRGLIGGLIAAFREFGEAVLTVTDGIGDAFASLREGNFREAGTRIKEALSTDLKGIDIGKAWAEGFQKGVDSEIAVPESVKELFSGKKKKKDPNGFNIPGVDEAAASERKKLVVESVKQIDLLGRSLSTNIGGIDTFNALKRDLEAVNQAIQTSKRSAEAGLAPQPSFVSLSTGLESFQGTEQLEAFALVLNEKLNNIDVLTNLREGFGSLGEVINQTATYTDSLGKLWDSLGGAMQSVAGAIIQAASSGETSFKKLGQAALKAAADVARAALIKVVSESLTKTFEKLGPLAVPLAAGIAGLAAGVFNSILKGLRIPALAQGGLAYSPTLALVGDNRGAGADPEVIAPLSKLKQYLGGGNQLIGNFRIAGRDLELVLERSQADSQRISPF